MAAIPWTLLGVITVLTTVLTVATAVLATGGALRAPPVQALGARE